MIRSNFVTAFTFSLLLATSASAMGNFSGTPYREREGGPPNIPEPAAAAVFGVGAVAIGYMLHRRTK